MRKKKFVIDASLFTSKTQAHEVMKKEFRGFEYYGNNLDALADCLSELGKNSCVVLTNDDDMRKNLGSYARRLISVIESTAAEYGFDFVICGEE